MGRSSKSAQGHGADDRDADKDASVGWLVATAGGIALLFAVMSAPLTRVGDPRSPAYEALAERPAPVDFAVLGNSRPHVGVSPKVVSEAIAAEGARATGYNFSVDGTDAVHHASFGMHGLLRAEPPPKVVVWAVDPLMFDASRRANRLEQLVRADVPLLVRARAPFELVLDVATMQVFPPYRHRPLVLAKVEDRTEGIGIRLVKLQRLAGLRTTERPKPREYTSDDDGFDSFVVVADWAYRFYERHAVHYAAEYEKLELSDWHEAFARSFLARARERGVLVVLLEMPSAPYYRTHFANGSKHTEWRERISRLAAEEGAVFWNDADRFESDELFGDPGHMPRATAEIYSRELGERLARDPRTRAALDEGKR